MNSMSARWDETWHRLREWTAGQGSSERLAAQILMEDGFTGLDPSHPLGGKDGKKDAIAERSGAKWVMAAYFPRGRKPFNKIKEKLLSDFEGVGQNNAEGLAFVTNQELSLGERSDLRKASPGPVDIYHLERITAILDKPSMQSVRAQFLQMDSATGNSTLKPVFVRIIGKSTHVPNNLLGRSREIEAIQAFLKFAPVPAPNILVITGMPGVGKTALALQAASSTLSLGKFKRGAILIDFNGYAVSSNERVEPRQVLSSTLVALGYTETEYEPEIMFVRLQSVLAELEASGERVLFILDNVSQVNQIQPLVPTVGAHRVIVTSRNSIAPRLPASDELRLAPLSAEEAVEVISQTARYSKNDSTEDFELGLIRLADICGCLPIALQLVGDILRSEEFLTPLALADELASESTRLAGLEFEDATIRAIFEGSYARLADAAARCFRFISVHPAQEFTIDSLSALLHAEQAEVRRAFRALEGSHLISRNLSQPIWTMHDLLRLYSAELFGMQDGPNAAIRAIEALNEYYFVTAEQANEWLNASSTEGERDAFRDWAEARAWMSIEVSGIVTSVKSAAERGDWNNSFRLAITLALYLDIMSDKAGCLAMAEAALAAGTALQDKDKEGRALNNLGLALNSMQRFEEAKGVFLEARKKFRDVGNKSEEASVLMGLSDVLRAEGSLQATVAPLRRAGQLFLEAGDLPMPAALRRNG
jgi:tetratricopeptide (TPR) repeat protein